MKYALLETLHIAREIVSFLLLLASATLVTCAVALLMGA
jgi:hypothetical protein